MQKYIKKVRNSLYRTLRWSERYTKTDMLYLTKEGSWVTFGQVVTSAISLLLIIAFANLLPKETYGLYRYILSLAAVLNIFTLTGMSSAVARSVAAGNEGVLRTSVLYQFKWNILMFAAFCAMSGYYFYNGDQTMGLSFLILGIFVPPTLALNTYGAYLEGKKAFKTASIFNVGSSIVYTAGILAAVVLYGEVIWLVFAYAATTFAATLFFYLVTVKIFRPSHTATAKETLKYGRELSFIRIIGPIASQIDKIVLAHFWGAAALATYTLALAIPERATSLMKKWVGIGFPKFAEKTPQELNTVFYRRIAQGMGIGIIAAGAYVLISPHLFTYLLPQYLDGILYSQILAVSLIFAVPTRYAGMLFESQAMSRYILINTVINNMLALVLYLILGIWGGVLGLVIARVLWSFLGMVVNLVAWRISTKS